MNKYLIFGFFFLCSNLCQAQTPTVVFGEAATPNGGSDELLLEQPQNAPNPLGDPITTPDIPQNSSSAPANDFVSNGKQKKTENSAQTTNIVSESLPIDPQPSAKYTLKKEDSMIQNTIYRGTDRLYDIQSIPLKALDKINVQGLEPDLTTYPVR